MVNFTILAGGFDIAGTLPFIATYLFNPDAGTLDVIGRFSTGGNCSWISSGFTNSSILYAVNEVSPEGALQSFTVTHDGFLSPAIDTVSSGGDRPAYTTALSNNQIVVMDYNSGTGRFIPLTDDGLYFDDSASSAGIITFPVPTAPTSEGVSHPHMALELEKEVLVPDLGGDTIWRLTQEEKTGNWTIVGSIPQPPGSGPRHIAVHDGNLYTLHELASTLTLQRIPAFPNGTSEIIADVSTVPPNPPAGAMFAAAEILIPKPTSQFPVPYIYASNRNTGVPDASGKGDAIAIFEHVNVGKADEGLELVAQVFTGLQQIRGMEVGKEVNGGNEFLIAAGVAGEGGTVVYRRVDGGRGLEEVARNLDIPTRSTFVWL
ncbi:putative isomerase YbhE [Dendrothele bispora CBS 962.96]|uniref:Putative isomerase YbhE n=1 Tax=Dendrothele bispora (strain CBS 962.96) TaxID=1314807 RepID=A0A4S8M8U0_DENBC|nr:putative isomerase YbhE [Dendrothele bispora CBS 962.96]